MPYVKFTASQRRQTIAHRTAEQAAQNAQLVAVVALVFAMLGNVIVWQLNQTQTESTAHLAKDTCRGLEALKKVQYEQIGRQILNSKKFLNDHPQGIPGISAKLIRDGIVESQRNQQQFAPSLC